MGSLGVLERWRLWGVDGCARVLNIEGNGLLEVMGCFSWILGGFRTTGRDYRSPTIEFPVNIMGA